MVLVVWRKGLLFSKQLMVALFWEEELNPVGQLAMTC